MRMVKQYLESITKKVLGCVQGFGEGFFLLLVNGAFWVRMLEIASHAHACRFEQLALLAPQE